MMCDNIISFELINFPYIKDVIVSCKATSYDNSFLLSGERLYFTKYLVNSDILLYNPYEIMFLIINGLPYDLNESKLFNYFSELPSYIYIDYIFDNENYKYMIMFNKHGIIDETLFKIKDNGLREEIKFTLNQNPYSTSLPGDYQQWFYRLNYYSFLDNNKDFNNDPLYKSYIHMHFTNKVVWENYADAIVDLIGNKYDIGRIEFISDKEIKIYNNDISDYKLLHDCDIHFINLFLLLAVVLKVLSIEQGILFISNCDFFQDYVLRLIFRLFNRHETNDKASQLIFTGSEDLLYNITLDDEQINYLIKKQKKRV